jgi:type IV pilus assembly protein PilA
MKKKGFTLIELIVVIAIIGVLAAILVPAMLGYVKKSKVTTANTTAKSLYNAVNTALVDLDSEDVNIAGFDGTVTSFTGTGSLDVKVQNYFSDIKKFEAKSQNGVAALISGGQCTAVGVNNGKYGGSYPKQMSVDDVDSNNTAALALAYAQT